MVVLGHSISLIKSKQIFIKKFRKKFPNEAKLKKWTDQTPQIIEFKISQAG